LQVIVDCFGQYQKAISLLTDQEMTMLDEIERLQSVYFSPDWVKVLFKEQNLTKRYLLDRTSVRLNNILSDDEKAEAMTILQTQYQLALDNHKKEVRQ
jgi:lipase chaperone LimK